MKTTLRKILVFAIILVVVLLPFALFGCGGNQTLPEPTSIVNPYNGVIWDEVLRLKANFHTHTTVSDGTLALNEKLLLYAEQGFDIVAITDHDLWGTDFSSNPWLIKELAGQEMLIIQGIEISIHRHFNSLFTHYGTIRGRNTDALINTHINNSEGILFLNHPGRYRADRWYINVFDRFPKERLVGMEVINRGMRYDDRDLWDRILTRHAPERAVWGFSNDDAHRASEVGASFNQMLVTENSVPNIKEAIVNGSSFMFARSNQNVTAPLPHIASVDICKNIMYISFVGSGYTNVRWISEGRVVGEGNSLKVSELRRYVRFELENENGMLLSQPFLLR